VLRRPVESTLAALVAVVNDTPGFALLQRHVQGREHEVCSHAFSHGPSHHTPAPDINDHGQIEEAHPGRYVGHVRYPQLVRTCGVETPVDQVMGRALALVTAGGDGEASALADAVDAGLSHETSHALAADAHALLDELGPHPGHAVGLVGVLMNLADALGHHRVGDAALGRGTLSPGIETAGGNAEDAAHGAHR
jgi:hypothetical protein